MLVYFDACTLQRPWDDRSIERNRLEAEAIQSLFAMIVDGSIEVVNSDLLEIELSGKTFPNRDIALEKLFAHSTVRGKIDMAVETLVPALMMKGLDEMDGLHLATAMCVFADVFCTVDDRLRKRAVAAVKAPPRILGPIELLKELMS